MIDIDAPMFMHVRRQAEGELRLQSSGGTWVGRRVSSFDCTTSSWGVGGGRVSSAVGPWDTGWPPYFVVRLYDGLWGETETKVKSTAGSSVLLLDIVIFIYASSCLGSVSHVCTTAYMIESLLYGPSAIGNGFF